MDWTEHQHHLAGPLRREILATCEHHDWIKAAKQPRALLLTQTGQHALQDLLQIDLTDAAAA